MHAMSMPDALRGAGWPEALRTPLLELNAQVAEAVATARQGALSSLWQAMAAEGRARAADCPFLLFDLGLARPGPWPGAVRGGVADLPAAGWRDAALVRRALHFAWHVARAHGPEGRVALGMSVASAGCLLACPLADLDRLAEQCPPWISPRWLDHPTFWRAWLNACHRGRDAEIERLRFWGLQRLGADVLARAP